MSTSAIVVILVVAVVVILILRARGESRGKDPMAEYQAGLRATKPDVQQIVQLLLAGKKIEAIQAYMELSGVGLEEAKNAVERYDPILKKFAVPSAPSLDRIDDWSEIDALLAAGRMIEAIKLYREKTGCGLKEAKDAVELRDSRT